MLQPDSATAAPSAADTSRARTSGLRFKRKLPRPAGSPRAIMLNRYPQGVPIRKAPARKPGFRLSMATVNER